MKVIYYTDTMTLILREESVAESDEVGEGIIADYNQKRKKTKRPC